MRTDKLDVSFDSILSRAENCFCDACHGTGRVTKLKMPETLYFDGGTLSTKYFNYWLCDKCRTMLAHALDWPEEEAGGLK